MNGALEAGAMLTLETGKPSVLVVEDDLLWRRMFRHTFDKHDVELFEARSLAEAVSAVADRAFDLVVMDFDLPDGCGLDLIDKVDRPRLGRIVLASGFVDSQDLPDDRCGEIARFLTKPFLSSDLVACLDGLFRLDLRHGRGEVVR
jgi:CheY-like chemotaxis protein